MPSRIYAAVAAGALLAVAGGTSASADHHMAGKAATSASSTIVEAAVATPDLSTLVAAVKAAGLVDTLSGAGPFTVFAPTNAAFGALPAGTVDTLLKPENKGQLTSVLTYHVVAGRVSAGKLAGQIQAGGGKATLTTVQGGVLTATAEGGAIYITDAKGGRAKVTAADLNQRNGVVHVIDKVLLP